MKSSDYIATRTELGFVKVVRQEFAFVGDFGFREVEALPTIVRYLKDDLQLNVFHGRMSYEVSMEIGRNDNLYPLWSLIHAVDPKAEEGYRPWAATTSAAVANGVEHLAALVRRYGARALQDDPAFFEELRKVCDSWAHDYALDVLASQIRPKAAAAFRHGRYREAGKLYQEIAERLTAAERAKLAFCRKRS